MTKEKKFYTCVNQKVFECLFFQEESKDLLKKLLEEILQVEIRTLELEMVEDDWIKFWAFLLVTNEDEEMSIQMNVGSQEMREKFYAYQMANYAYQMDNRAMYDEAFKVYQIDFMYGLGKEKLDREEPEIYELMDDDGHRYVTNFRIYEYNMDKLMIIWESKNKEKIEKYKHIMMLGLNHDDLQVLSENDEWGTKYKNTLEELNKNKKFRSLIEEKQED